MDWTWVRTYEPHIHFDRNEPFFPVRIGVSLLKPGDRSPSFRRTFRQAPSASYTIIEYAIYWDYDIQHLYELEHVWVYVGENGDVLDCEASFHGRYFKALLKDRSNMDGTHIQLYSQPGKHAFMPDPDWFQLVPELIECASEDAGKGGLLVNEILRGKVATNPDIDSKVRDYLREHAFIPAMRFDKKFIPENNHYVSWPQLLREIPERIHKKLRELNVLIG